MIRPGLYVEGYHFGLGTGSNPPWWKGWHFSNRHTVMELPFNTPNRRI